MAADLRDFIRNRIRRDLDEGTLEHGVVTRFPPEPNGHLHIGHAKSICLNFGVAEEFGGKTYLRFDDTNPSKESHEFVESIQKDVNWLGFDWGENLTFASDYFDQLFAFAKQLIVDGKAFVCSQSADEMRQSRGTLTEPGTDSPFRDRTVAENVELFERMRAGAFDDGDHVLRARIDMASPNINLRDPVLYRIMHKHHHRTGDRWCIYPMYDFTHCICDALEGISHSLCTLEFEDHRPLYDWVSDNINIDFHPPQIEFSRLGLEYNVMSKRALARLVGEGKVDGWSDPRLPTLAGLRRRGVPAGAIREFCQRIGVTKQENLVEVELLEFCIRQELEGRAPRAMAVLEPLRVLVTNFVGEDEVLNAPWHPQYPEMGTRELLFGRELFIERSDFSDDPPKKFKRLSPGAMIRLRYAYIIRCDEVERNESGDIQAIRATYFPDSRSGNDSSGLKPKGVIHYVAASNALRVEVRSFGHLFRTPDPKDMAQDFNADSVTSTDGVVERAIVETPDPHVQFERTGYFYRESSGNGSLDGHGVEDALVFNQTVSLRDSWKPGP
ncbi:MAG: glutamine--tRNA ligase/YqeY domain fusion protein [Pseudomonadales bacterium]|nr:glutamine--tRNA ligase/YqeY domain fusion protein [Pseudomonadales bacterium]